MKEFLTFIFIAGIIMLGIALVTNAWSKSTTRSACMVFSQESNRKTKFVEYTFWTRDCLTMQENGKWISAYNLRDK